MTGLFIAFGAFLWSWGALSLFRDFFIVGGPNDDDLPALRVVQTWPICQVLGLRSSIAGLSTFSLHQVGWYEITDITTLSVRPRARTLAHVLQGTQIGWGLTWNSLVFVLSRLQSSELVLQTGCVVLFSPSESALSPWAALRSSGCLDKFWKVRRRCASLRQWFGGFWPGWPDLMGWFARPMSLVDPWPDLSRWAWPLVVEYLSLSTHLSLALEWIEESGFVRTWGPNLMVGYDLFHQFWRRENRLAVIRRN